MQSEAQYLRTVPLAELLEETGVTGFRGPEGVVVKRLCYDSRQVEPGDCFVAVAGTASDGHDYIGRAVGAGAAAVVCERLPESLSEGVAYAVVPDSAAALGRMAAAYYGHPSRELKLVGVTGTNGKTTIATLLSDLFHAAGYRTGLVSTVVYRIDRRTCPSTHTTPDALRLQALLREMVDAGCDYCFMEVSSHAVAQKRIEGLSFAGGIFTNLTHDHLDYHKTFAEYLRVKKRFFDTLPAAAFALVNADDRNGAVMLQNCAARQAFYSLREAADFTCKLIESRMDGMLLRLGGQEVWVNLTGRFNASNLTALYGAAVLLGLDPRETLRLMSALRSVSGRFDTLQGPGGTTGVVDYAHTPDALENVLKTIGEIRRPGQHIVCVCGCGGDRDRTKRPEMARVALRYADTAIFTSDNPRHESPEAILDEMVAGLGPGSRYLRITDRAQAIRTAVLTARPGDVVLVAGKGHETYQIVGDERRPFDDREELRNAFALLENR